MRGIDTNVLLRYIATDDPEQTRIAASLMAAAEENGDLYHISTIALCELIWALRGNKYRVRRDGIASTVENLLSSSVFEIQDRDLVRFALEDYRNGEADFADYLIGWQNRHAGCTETVTFDRDLEGTAGFDYLLGQSS
jgi:predicted nucleic-acid-binding protein